jgi:hypothetical protein
MSTIITRNSATSGSVPSSLIQGELAINVKDGRLFYGSGSGNIVKEFTVSGSGGGGTIDTSSFATTGSNIFIGNQIISGSLHQSGTFYPDQIDWFSSSIGYDTGSYILTTTANGLTTYAGYGDVANTLAPYIPIVSSSISASYATTASYALNGGVTQLLAGPNITLSPTTGVGQVTISSTGGGGGTGNTATGSYGSFYSTQTQTNVAGTARSMSLNTTDITNGVSISGSTNPFNTYIKVANAGVYDIQFSAQVDKTDSGTDEIWIWIRKNGSNISDSATSIQLVGNGAHYVAAWNFFVNAAAGDYFQLMWYSPDANVRLHAESAFGVVPGIPSLIVTANRVDQFLSNTGSFSGSFTGNLIGTASYATQALSASWAPSGISTPTFPYTGSAIISGSLEVTGSLFVQDINGIINIDSSNRKLYDTISSQSVAWDERRLYDNAGNRAVAWQNKVLGESNGGSSVGWDYPNLTQAVEFSSYTRNNIDLGVVGENFANFPSYAAFLPQGEILKNGVTFDAAVADFDLVYLETDNIWYPVDMTTTSATKMLGIAFGIANFDNQVLIEGTMVVNSIAASDTPKVDLVDHGLPIYIKTGAGTFMATTAPGSSGSNIRVLGHAYYNSTTAGDYWIMKFRPSNSWVTI